jgi:hypothetical protein
MFSENNVVLVFMFSALYKRSQFVDESLSMKAEILEKRRSGIRRRVRGLEFVGAEHRMEMMQWSDDPSGGPIVMVGLLSSASIRIWSSIDDPRVGWETSLVRDRSCSSLAVLR